MGLAQDSLGMSVFYVLKCMAVKIRVGWKFLDFGWKVKKAKRTKTLDNLN